MTRAPRRSRTILRAALVAASVTTSVVTGPVTGAGAEPPAAMGSVAVHLTREDTTSIDVTEPFAPPGRNPVVGDFVGGTSGTGLLDDILWYTPGTGGDELWRTEGNRTWFAAPTDLSVNGTYTPIVGYFTTADTKADIFWYAPGPTTDWLWDFNDNGSITRRSFSINGTYTPIKGYFGDDGAEDIIWYAPGPAADSWWDYDSAGLTQRPLNISGTYTPVVGSFSGVGSPTFDAATDIIWYAPGSAADALWDFNTDHTIVRTALTINGAYTPVPGDFTHDGFEDVIWYAPGTAKDYLWNFTNATGAKAQTNLTINGTYTPLTGELFEESDHRTDILWFRPGSGADFIWDYANADSYTTRPANLVGNLEPVLGTFEFHPYPSQGGGTGTGFGLDILDRTS